MDTDSVPAPRALLLVRNGVEHDARVLRAAGVLRAEGYAVLIAGVETAGAPAGRTTLDGLAVVRVPGSLRASVPRSDGPATAPQTSADRPGASSAAAPGWTAKAAVRRTVRAGVFARGAIRVARRWAPDLIHANDHNTMWAALAIRRLTGAPVVYDSHELWADRNNRPEWRPGLLAAEALFVRAADALITASPGYSQALAQRHRIAVPQTVRNIPETGASAPGPATPPHGRPEIVYVGGLMRGRGLEIAIDALALLPDVRLRLVGPSSAAYEDHLRRHAQAAGVADRVLFSGAVPPGGVVDAARGAQVGLALIEPICRSYELTLPNKLYEYVQAGVPVLASPVPVLAGVVRDHGLGRVSPSLRPIDVAATITTLLTAEVQHHALDAARRYATANSWAVEARALARVYAEANGLPAVPSVRRA